MSETNKQQSERRVSGSELSGLVMRVLCTGKPQKLSKEETISFHNRFASEIAPVIAEHRRKQRIMVV